MLFTFQYEELELRILRQPEEQHRARYMSEGSRGSVKDRSGKSHCTVAVSKIIFSRLHQARGKLVYIGTMPSGLPFLFGSGRTVGLPFLASWILSTSGFGDIRGYWQRPGHTSSAIPSDSGDRKERQLGDVVQGRSDRRWSTVLASGLTTREQDDCSVSVPYFLSNVHT